MSGLKCLFCHRGEEVKDVCGKLQTQVPECCSHLKCKQYSAMLMQYRFEHNNGFKVEKVIDEIKRGRALPCTICKQRKKKNRRLPTTGATAGCAYKKCSKTFHFYCADKDKKGAYTKRHTHEVEGKRKPIVLYRVYCGQPHEEKAKPELKRSIEELLNADTSDESGNESDVPDVEETQPQDMESDDESVHGGDDAQSVSDDNSNANASDTGVPRPDESGGPDESPETPPATPSNTEMQMEMGVIGNVNSNTYTYLTHPPNFESKKKGESLQPKSNLSCSGTDDNDSDNSFSLLPNIDRNANEIGVIVVISDDESTVEKQSSKVSIGSPSQSPRKEGLKKHNPSPKKNSLILDKQQTNKLKQLNQMRLDKFREVDPNQGRFDPFDFPNSSPPQNLRTDPTPGCSYTKPKPQKNNVCLRESSFSPLKRTDGGDDKRSREKTCSRRLSPEFRKNDSGFCSREVNGTPGKRKTTVDLNGNQSKATSSMKKKRTLDFDSDADFAPLESPITKSTPRSKKQKTVNSDSDKNRPESNAKKQSTVNSNTDSSQTKSKSSGKNKRSEDSDSDSNMESCLPKSTPRLKKLKTVNSDSDKNQPESNVKKQSTVNSNTDSSQTKSKSSGQNKRTEDSNSNRYQPISSSSVKKPRTVDSSPISKTLQSSSHPISDTDRSSVNEERRLPSSSERRDQLLSPVKQDQSAVHEQHTLNSNLTAQGEMAQIRPITEDNLQDVNSGHTSSEKVALCFVEDEKLRQDRVLVEKEVAKRFKTDNLKIMIWPCPGDINFNINRSQMLYINEKIAQAFSLKDKSACNKYLFNLSLDNLKEIDQEIQKDKIEFGGIIEAGIKKMDEIKAHLKKKGLGSGDLLFFESSHVMVLKIPLDEMRSECENEKNVTKIQTESVFKTNYSSDKHKKDSQEREANAYKEFIADKCVTVNNINLYVRPAEGVLICKPDQNSLNPAIALCTHFHEKVKKRKKDRCAPDTPKILILGPVKSEIVHVVKYYQEMFPKFLEEHVTMQSDVWCIVDLSQIQNVTESSDISLKKVLQLDSPLLDHLNIEAFSCFDPSVHPLSCVVIHAEYICEDHDID